MGEAYTIFVWIWGVSILASFFAQGVWGEKLAKEDLISPVPVALLWPFGLALLVVAMPFMIAYFIGRLFAAQETEHG